MAGFKNIRTFANASTDSGANWITNFRKVPAATATVTGQWFDYSTASGIPVPNYYASAPAEAARLEGIRGIYVPSVSPAKQFLRKLTLMAGAAGANNTQGQNQEVFLLDYLLYYPFVDLDAAGEEQTMTNTVTIPRYTDGKGVMGMLVAQAPTVGGGRFTINYTNSDGVPGRVTPTIYCAAAQPAGAITNAIGNAAGVNPFIPLQAGDSGIRSVQSLTMAIANGGLAAIVLVKVIERHYIMQECRRAANNSFGAATELERIRMKPGLPEIKDGAFLGFIGRGAGGTLQSCPLVGYIETVWG